jgi:hypothetical protein
MATKHTSTIKSFLEIAPFLPGNISVLLRGKHGIGKSQLVAGIAEQLSLPLVDRRLSQMSEGDMIGLPQTDGNVTRFCPPDWYMRACNEAVMLFLDEFNRALPEVMQAGFQIILDRELNGNKLHQGTRVFAAVNCGAEYVVNEMDPALLRRFWVVDLAPTAAEWVSGFARGRLHNDTVDFIVANEKWLDPPVGADLSDIHPTRHSWERCDTTLRHLRKMSDPESTDLLDINDSRFFATCVGFLGADAASAFRDFIKTIDRQVTGEEILTKYPKVRDKVLKLGQEKWNVCIEKLTDQIEKTPKITATHIKNVEAFMTDLPGELRVMLWSKLTAKGVSKIAQNKSLWKACMPRILEIFKVMPGVEGVGMIPDIPGLKKPGADSTK